MRGYQEKYEIMYGYKTNEKEDEPFYKLIEAIEKNDEKAVQDLIDKKIELNVYLWNNEIKRYETPLIVSIRKGYDTITMLLLENGAKVNFNSILGDCSKRTTALGIAVSTGNYKMTKNLIKRNANLNVAVPPVLIAIKRAQNSKNEEDKNKYYEIAKLLIESGAKLGNWYILEEARKLDMELGRDDLSVEINKKEKEDRRKKLREEYIIKTKEYIQRDDELKSKFEDKTIELYTDLKMGTLSNIVELDGEEVNDLLLLTNYKKQKLKVASKTYEITKQDIKDLECKAPIYIRMVEGEEPSYKHNETGVELEIRKLLRSNSLEETL